jgi:flagellar hook-basal body complex protein FliE
MAINFSAAASAYANAGRIMTPPPAATPGAGAGSSFGDLLKNAADGVVDALHKGEAATMQAATGKADLSQVTAAVTNAEVALQTVTAVRDKMVQAYQSILQMPI